MRKRETRGKPIEPITAESLRELLATKVMVLEKAPGSSDQETDHESKKDRRSESRYRMPGDAELKELARILERWRNAYLADQEDPIRCLKGEAKSLLARLKKIVGEIDGIESGHLSDARGCGARPGVLEKLTARLAEINEVRKRILHVEASSVWNIRPGLGFGGWRWLGDVLRQDFVNAMKAENPNSIRGSATRGRLPASSRRWCHW
jgi:DNA-binding FrmR family transcriptional regulator